MALLVRDAVQVLLTAWNIIPRDLIARSHGMHFIILWFNRTRVGQVITMTGYTLKDEADTLCYGMQFSR